MRLGRRIRIGGGVVGVGLLLMGILHWEKTERINDFLTKEAEVPRTIEWGEPVDGVQVSLSFWLIKEIEGSSGGAVMTDGWRTWTTQESYTYPWPGTKPHLMVSVLVRNTSSRTVYLIGDKSRSGTEMPAFAFISVQHGNDPPVTLNLRAAFDEHRVHVLPPGASDPLGIESIPYDDFAASGPKVKIRAFCSIVHEEHKFLRRERIQAESVAYSNAIVPPWDLLKLYFETIWWG